MRAEYKKPIALGALWLAIFIVLTFVSAGWGGAGENAWIVSWGYPDWIGIESVEEEQYDFKPGENQWEVLSSHWPRGVVYFDKIGFLFALSVAFAPIVLVAWTIRIAKNGFRFQLSTLLVLVLVSGVLLGVHLNYIQSNAGWGRGWAWYTISECTIPTLSAAVTLCFLAAAATDWWSRRKPKSPAQT